MNLLRKNAIRVLCFVFAFIFAFPIGVLAAGQDDPGYPRDLGTDFSRYVGKKIGVTAGQVQEQYVKTMMPGAVPAYYESFADMTIALKNDKIDGFIVPHFTLLQICKETSGLTYDPAIIDSNDVCFIFSEGEKQDKIREELNEFIAQVRADGTLQEWQDLCLEHDTYTQPVDFSDLTGENGTIKYGTATTIIPFAYLGDGGYTGVDLLLLHEFFKQYGYKCDMETPAFASVLTGVASGAYEMGGGGISYSEERAKSVRFSDPYMDSIQVMALKADSERTGLFSKITDGFRRTFVEEARFLLILRGLLATLIITFSSFAAGILLAVPVSMMLMSKKRFPNKAAGILIRIMQGTPVVVILMILYYVIFNHLRINGILVAIIGFSILIAAECGELYYRSLRAIDPGQAEAGLSIGLTRKGVYRYVLIPQAMRSILPGFRNSFISLLKGTAIVGYIAVEDLTKMSDIIRGRTYEAFFPLITTAVIYFIVSWLTSRFFARLCERFEVENRKREIKGVVDHA